MFEIEAIPALPSAPAAESAPLDVDAILALDLLEPIAPPAAEPRYDDRREMLANIKPGDRVGIQGKYCRFGTGVVAKVLKTKIILESGSEFNRRGDKSARESLPCLVTAEYAAHRLALEAASRETNELIRGFQAKVQQITDAHTNGYGHRGPITAAEKAELLKLVESLPTRD